MKIYLKTLGYSTMLFVILCSVLLIISCHNPKTVNQNTVQNSDSAIQSRNQNMDTAEQMAFKRHEEELIQENNKKIAELKAKIKKERSAMSGKYNEQLDTLDQENARMEGRLNEFKEQGKADWTTFKYNFNRDMDSLGRSISRFAERNMNTINKEQ